MDDTRELRLRIMALEAAVAALLHAQAKDGQALKQSVSGFMSAMQAQTRYWENLLASGTPEQGLMALEMSGELGMLATDIGAALDRIDDAPPG